MKSIKRRLKREADGILPGDELKQNVKRQIFGETSETERKNSSAKRRTSPQLKGLIAAAVSFCLVIAISLGAYFGLQSNGAEKFGETYISIDINPSFEVIADGNDCVTAVNALNKDAVIVLYGKVDKYIGRPAAEVCADVVKESIKLGYVNDLNNEIDILAVNGNKSKENSVLDAVKAKVDGALAGASGARVVVKNETAGDGMRALIADACRILGISEEEAADMSVGDLNKRMKNYDKKTLEKLEDELEAQYEANKDVWGGLDDDALEDAIDEWKEAAKEEEEKIDDLLDDYLDWYEEVYLPSRGITGEDDIERLVEEEEERLEKMSRDELKKHLNDWANSSPDIPGDDDDEDDD